MLTSKQEAFCQSVVCGNSLSDAYRSAYSADKMKATSINANSSKLLANTTIALRIDYLKKELADKALWSREDSLNEFISIVKEPDNQGCKINALKELNVMCGYNAPTKTETSGVIINKIEVCFGRSKS